MCHCSHAKRQELARGWAFEACSFRSLLNRLRNKPVAEELVAALERERPDEFRVCQQVLQFRASSALHDSDVDEIVNELRLSEMEIRKKWQEARLRRSREGTWMHAQFECLLNGGSLHVNTLEVALLAKFFESQRDMVVFRTEWKVYADKEDVAGSIDYVAIQADGTKVIVDWKRSGIWKKNAKFFLQKHATRAGRYSRLRALALPHAAERFSLYLAALLLGDRVWDIHCRDHSGQCTRTIRGRRSRDGCGDSGPYGNLRVSVGRAVVC